MTGYGLPLDSKKHWFAAYNEQRTADSLGNKVYAFQTKEDREFWILKMNSDYSKLAPPYSPIRRRDAARILGLTKHTQFVWGEGNQVILALRPGEMDKPWQNFYDKADLSSAAAKLGQKGGSAKSERKTNAARENAKKPRTRKEK